MQVLSGNIETVSIKEKSKFPLEFYPDVSIRLHKSPFEILSINPFKYSTVLCQSVGMMHECSFMHHADATGFDTVHAII